MPQHYAAACTLCHTNNLIGAFSPATQLITMTGNYKWRQLLANRALTALVCFSWPGGRALGLLQAKAVDSVIAAD